MMKRSHLFAIALISGAASFAGAAAQSGTADVDLAAIRARAQQQMREADDLAATARARAESVKDDARKNAETALSHGRDYSAQAHAAAKPDPSQPFDFDAMVANAGSMATDGMGEAPRFIAFASTSMPPASLRAMIDDVGQAGGVVVLRGLPQNSAKAMTAAFTKIARPGENLAGVGIDPRLFRAFAVEAVPTYVVTASDFDLCDGFDCRTAVPPHDRMSGNVTVAHVLEKFAAGGGPGARIAAQHLDRLERSRP